MPLDLAPLLKQIKIKTKRMDVRPFDLNYIDPEFGDMSWAQRPFIQEIERQHNAGKPVRIIVLKARQLGISTATEGVLFWWSFIYPGANSLVVSYEASQVEELFQMVRTYWDSWPFNPLYKLRRNTQKQLSWEQLMSQLKIATAKNVQSGRGHTIQGLHLSEFAFYPDPETLMTGLSQTIPNAHGTIIVIESTANGVGNAFYDKWYEAESGESEYTPLFFPWFRHPEYRRTTTLSSDLELDAEERNLKNLGCNFEALQWRRWAIIDLCSGDINKFHQEYPSTPEEAFVASGIPIFVRKYLDECYRPIPAHRGLLVENSRGDLVFEHDPLGNLYLYKAPKLRDRRQDKYFISGDPSETITGDPACIQVVNRRTFEQVAVWHGRIDPLHFADEMIKLGRYYNNATLCPEVEGGGQATVARLLTLNYPNIWQHRQPDRVPGRLGNAYGWSTNWQRKSWAIGTLQKLFVDGSAIIRDKKTYVQLCSYVDHGNGVWGNSNNKIHDDAVMSLAINYTAYLHDGINIDPEQVQGEILEMFNQQVVGVG